MRRKLPNEMQYKGARHSRDHSRQRDLAVEPNGASVEALAQVATAQAAKGDRI